MARSVNRIDLEFLPKGLHDIGQAGMSARLQEVVGRRGRITLRRHPAGLRPVQQRPGGPDRPHIPLVPPAAHDCITLFLGSRQRYMEYFQAHPGAYFKTTGWIERGSDL